MFSTFWKKQPYRISTSEIIESERRGYLNAWKVLFLKTSPQFVKENSYYTQNGVSGAFLGAKSDFWSFLNPFIKLFWNCTWLKTLKQKSG